MTTVKQLKEALAKLSPEADAMEIRIWLPGSEIYLSDPYGNPPSPFVRNGKIMIEGNLAEGSALAE